MMVEFYSLFRDYFGIDAIKKFIGVRQILIYSGASSL